LEGHRFLVFGVAERICACDLGAVKEIVPGRVSTRLPGAPAWVSGLINLRGSLVTVLDLALRLGATEAPRDGGQVIVAEAGGRAFGLRVDDVRVVRTVGEEALESVDEQRSAGGIVRGLAHLELPGVVGVSIALVCDIEAIAREAFAT
jgi:purine-binding chemotaxis protein CheW